MWHRRVVALASAVSAAVALHLHLWKLGMTEAPLACAAGGGCVTAQMSWYGWFLGVDVALIGAVGYVAIVLVAGVGSLRRFADARWPTVALMALVWPAVLFTLRLKYGELVVLRTFCPWCAVSAVTITLNAVLVTLDWGRVRGGEARRDGATRRRPSCRRPGGRAAPWRAPCALAGHGADRVQEACGATASRGAGWPRAT